MKKVYLLLGCIEYEGCSAIAAYSSFEAAEKAKEEAIAYNLTRPKCPPMDASSEEWDKFICEKDKWEENHPTGHSVDDFYSISVFDIKD